MKNNLEKIYVSTLAFEDSNLDSIIRLAYLNNLNLEFSSNLFHKDNILKFLNFSNKKIIHNYFPAPKTPFVMNLASQNQEILNKSLDHCKKNIELSIKCDLPFYAFHSGFCVDPDPLELGSVIVRESKLERNKFYETFLNSLNNLLGFIGNENFNLLIENNVLTYENLKLNNYQNILLCTESIEINKVFNNINNPKLGLLLDIGHLNVSARTHGNDKISELSKLSTHTLAIHHSDNNEKQDSNSCFNEDYWFLNYKKSFNDIYHIIEVKSNSIKSIQNQIKLLC